ncbi:MAG TPA: hypothetical protein VG733_05055 [Chthoniobacteraceae bacterium]|nr:hypothetical protein [Chthoniobacteraceae bacterium]
MITVMAFFVGLLVAGLVKEELGWRSVFLWLVVGAALFGVFVAFRWQPYFLLAAYALLDIILVFVVFKGDIQIS